MVHCCKCIPLSAAKRSGEKITYRFAALRVLSYDSKVNNIVGERGLVAAVTKSDRSIVCAACVCVCVCRELVDKINIIRQGPHARSTPLLCNDLNVCRYNVKYVAYNDNNDSNNNSNVNNNKNKVSVDGSVIVTDELLRSIHGILLCDAY